ncbi:MAG: DUF2330 domain-containing protein [Sandaracinaceae bacterium]
MQPLRSLMAASAVVLLLPSMTHAFCGFYVKQDDTRVTSEASRVVLFRDGTTTVLSMQNSYEGPPEDFALIVPVPTAIGENDVRVIEPAVFERIDELTSPRLVEYEERQPYCPSHVGSGRIGYGAGGGMGGVAVEARFAVGEYDVVVLSASDSTGLEQWLRTEGYRIPEGASRALRPYIQNGFRFFAARVNAERVRVEEGRAVLSPLRIHYTSAQLTLPIRLGRLSSPGQQDLIVYVLSREGRFEVANRRNVFVPTNLVVRPSVMGRFGAFYDALLDRVWSRDPNAVVTEYAWSATSCDPCPGPTMDAEDITTLGGDHASDAYARVVGGGTAVSWTRPARGGGPFAAARAQAHTRRLASQIARCITEPTEVELTLGISVERGRLVSGRHNLEGSVGACVQGVLDAAVSPAERDGVARVHTALQINRRVQRSLSSARGFTVTRMRLRNGPRSPTRDLVFRRAVAVRGGVGEPDENARMPGLERGGTTNTFQARYAVLHRLEEVPDVECDGPLAHGGWGAPSRGLPESAPTLSAPDPDAPEMSLRDLLMTPVPSLGLRPRRASLRYRARPAMRAPAPLAWTYQRRSTSLFWRRRTL